MSETEPGDKPEENSEPEQTTDSDSGAYDSTVLKVEVQPSLEDFLDEAGETIAARTSGEATGDEATDHETDTITPDDSPHHPYKVSFHSREALHRAVREETIDLLETVATEQPESIRDLARRLDRDVRRVHDDVTELADLQLLALEAGDGRAKRPVVWYDELDISIPLRDGDSESGEEGEAP